jgi:hypothetical protein
VASPSLTDLVDLLAKSGVELVLVGGLAAAAQGAPIATFDVDIVHRRTAENVVRLLAVLATIDARYRGRPGGEVLRPTAPILLGPGHSLLMTALGPLDVLGAIEGGRDYDALLPRSTTIEIRGHAVQVLELELLVELKRQSTHPKDLARLPILEETLRRLRET